MEKSRISINGRATICLALHILLPVLIVIRSNQALTNMNGYMESVHLTTNLSRSTSRHTSSNTNTRLLRPFPSSNTDPIGNELNTPEGTYAISQEVYNKDILPQFATGTHISLSDTNTLRPQPTNSLGILSTKDSSASSSMSEQLQQDKVECSGMYSVEEREEDGWDESSDNPLPSIQVSALQALPIPNASSHRTFASHSSGEQGSPCRPSQSETVGGGSFSRSSLRVYPSNGSYIQDPVSLSVELAQEELSSSLGGGSSVGSFSSLFSKGLRHHSHAKRPKNSLAKQKSSFISKVVVHDQLTKLLSSRTSEDNFMFINIGLNFMWMDGKNSKECLTNIVFSNAYPTCHDLNRHTSSTNEHMDIIIGFSSGDFIWYDPISHKYSRFNKNGILNNSAVTTVKWIPESEDLFLAGFEDGTILIIDKERDDQPLSIPVVPNTWADEQFKVSKPYRHSKYNPVSHWRVSKQAIAAFCFSPDGSHVAVAGQDGLMKIIQYNQEKLCDIYMGYFGKINCVAWSPDGKYILTGGQDDLVAIWSFPEQRIVARCQGHKSWVNGVAFDPWRFDGKVYRFASIGEDCNLIMWDFSVNALHRPKQKVKHAPVKTALSPRLSKSTNQFSQDKEDKDKEDKEDKRTSRLFHFNHSKNHLENSNQMSGKAGKRTSVGITFNGSMWSLEAEETLHTQLPVFHRFLNKAQVPFLQPVSIQTIHADPCVDIVFRKDSIHTTDRRGRVRKWDRPK